ncbi:AraC family transcriptional regulator [Bacillus swezeyi]
MRKTRKTIDEIAYLDGYEIGYFYRTFKKYFGKSTSRFRVYS